MNKSKIFEFLESLPRDQKIVYVKDLRVKFLDSEIQTLTWDCPAGWNYSAPANYQESDLKWILKNVNTLITMQNGNLVFYFYREG